MIIVLHNRSFLDAGCPWTRPEGAQYVPNVDELYPVAFVPGEDLDLSVLLTQNITHNWTQNAEVIKTDVGGQRSTSVGDVLILSNKAYVVAPVGFSEWETDVPALWEQVKNRTKGSLGPLVETREEDFRTARL